MTRAPSPADAAERAHAALLETLPSVRSGLVGLARCLRQIEEAGGWGRFGCGGATEYGRRYLRLSFRETLRLLGLGQALAVRPGLEDAYLRGELSLDEASLLGRIYADPEMADAGEDWERLARVDGLRALAQRYQQVRAEQGRRERMLAYTIHLRAGAVDRFERARVIASRQAQHRLTPGEAFDAVVAHFLDDFDGPDARSRRAAARRAGHRAPAEGRRARTGPGGPRRRPARCEIFTCRSPVARPAAPEARAGRAMGPGRADLCTTHTRWRRRGRLRNAGTPLARIWVNPWGEVIGSNSGPAPPRRSRPARRRPRTRRRGPPSTPDSPSLRA